MSETRPSSQGSDFVPPLSPESAQAAQNIANAFNKLYYDTGWQTWQNTHWMGYLIYKYPTDLWVYQEILHETRPTVIIETGTMNGASALFLAQTGENLSAVAGGGTLRILSIDINNSKRAPRLPKHPCVEYFSGSSTDAAKFAEIRSRLRPDDRVMVILDSDHSQAHVSAEMELYGPLVTPGCFMIVEDSNVNGHPVYSAHGPGPLEALAEFLPRHPEFQRDRAREKFMLTANPHGYLRRV